mmetsp:Transcript_50879/g.133708  ORF Transcript_50879/g.133708 Transcript_50879/m.133708 type:complete len:278 (-) Transcript_50879:20-853(-)
MLPPRAALRRRRRGLRAPRGLEEQRGVLGRQVGLGGGGRGGRDGGAVGPIRPAMLGLAVVLVALVRHPRVSFPDKDRAHLVMMVLLHLDNLPANVLIHAKALLLHDLILGHLDNFLKLLGHIVDVRHLPGPGDGHVLFHDLPRRLPDLLPDVLVAVDHLFLRLDDSLLDFPVLFHRDHLGAFDHLLLKFLLQGLLDHWHLHLFFDRDMDLLLDGVDVGPAHRHLACRWRRGGIDMHRSPDEPVVFGLTDLLRARQHGSPRRTSDFSGRGAASGGRGQ